MFVYDRYIIYLKVRKISVDNNKPLSFNDRGCRLLTNPVI